MTSRRQARNDTARIEETSKRLDGWINALTGIGAALRDKRLNVAFEPDLLTRVQLESIWRGDDMAARIVEAIPNEMLREWFDVTVQGEESKDISEAVGARLEELNTHEVCLDALCYERAYGGGAILVGANDGEQDLREPLREDRIQSLDWLTALASYELYPTSWYDNPRAANYGKPKTYRMQPEIISTSSVDANIEVHESRLICFNGIKVSKRQTLSNNGWGDSVLVRCHRVLSDFHQTWGAAGILLQDFAQAILKVKDLADLIATNQDDVVIKRAQILDMSRSVARMTLIDAEEDFERKPTPMTGLPEMLQQFALRLSAAADMPVSLLLGQAPAGLNATGDSDIRFFYDRTRARQNTRLRPAMSRLVKLIMLAKNGPTRGQEVENWSINFHRLWQMSDTEKADIRLKTSQADAADIASGVLTAAEVAVSRYGGDHYSTETALDLEGRSVMNEPARPPAPEPARVDAGMRVRAPARIRTDDIVEGDVQEYELRDVQGFPIVIDRPRGTTQKGIAADGVTPWSRTYLVDYGFFLGTLAPDGEGVDVYIGPSPDVQGVHIIQQLTRTGELDEPKVMIGFVSRTAAIEMFLAHMPEWALGSVETTDIKGLSKWLDRYRAIVGTMSGVS